jgi:hypothetical protein
MMKKLEEILFTLIMGFLMSLFITLALSYIRLGWSRQFVDEWLSVWVYTYPIVIICMLTFKPVSMALTNFLMKRIG